MNSLFNKIHTLLKAGQSIVAATIYSSSGSSPRTSGAKMIVLEDESIFGTIGGGRMEAEVQQKAKNIFKSKQGSEILEFNLNGTEDTDMICGGDVRILLEYVDASDEKTRKIYKQIEDCTRNNEAAVYITEFTEDKKSTKHYVVNEDIGNSNLDPRIIELLKKEGSFRSLKFAAFDNKRFILEPASISDTVYIFGAGHVSKKLAEVTKMTDFKTVVLDDRKEFANKQRFPDADRIVVLASIDEPFKDINIDKNSYIVIVTRAHASDLKVLRQALKSKAGYIGMMGSKRKKLQLLSKLEQEGFSSEDFNRVHCPIGIEIDAETPEEIAISIAAELIKVRAEK